MKQYEQVILYIDDDKDSCELVKVMFELAGYKVITCLTANEGLLHTGENSFAAIILDNWFENSSGVEICHEIRNSGKLTPVIFFTAEARSKEREKGLNAGANAYLIKPDDLDVLTETVIKLIEK